MHPPQFPMYLGGVFNLVVGGQVNAVPNQKSVNCVRLRVTKNGKQMGLLRPF